MKVSELSNTCDVTAWAVRTTARTDENSSDLLYNNTIVRTVKMRCALIEIFIKNYFNIIWRALSAVHTV